MLSAFIHIRLLDFIDIILVAILFYQLYMLIRGTVAYSITLGIAAIYLFWWAVRAMQMELLSTILGSVLGVGVIALIIVFQQEIRRFLIFIGSRYVEGNRISVEKILNIRFESKPQVKIRSIMKAVMQFSLEKTGALIVIRNKSNLDMYAETGDVLNAETSSRLFVSIFNKTSPLHDGAVIVENDKIKDSLGWNQTVTLQEGIAQTVAWYKENEGWWKPLKEKLSRESKGFWSKN